MEKNYLFLKIEFSRVWKNIIYFTCRSFTFVDFDKEKRTNNPPSI